MDWVMCLLPFAVCFVGFLAAAKVTKKKKRILAAAGVVLFLAAAYGSLAVYRNQKITKPSGIVSCSQWQNCVWTRSWGMQS